MESLLTYWQVILLAIVHGVTEFVPISSSGHLVLFRNWFNWSDQSGLVIDTILHAGSLTALLIYFWREWKAIIHAYFSTSDPAFSSYRRLPWLLVVATIPVVIAGSILKPFLAEGQIVRNNVITGLSMMMTAFFYWLAERRFTPEDKPVGFPQAIFIGCMQIIALLPGASRSGWTTGAGMLSGYKREASVRFAFFMAIPAIAGAVIFQVRDIIASCITDFDPLLAGTGFIVSFLISLSAIHLCLLYFRAHSLKIFSIYLAIIGLLAVLVG